MSNIINKEEALKSIEDGKLTIVDFFATWCGPCQMLMPIFIEASNKHSDISMSKIDIDEDPELASTNLVTGVPTVVAFKNGKEVSRVSGYQSEEELEEFINSVK